MRCLVSRYSLAGLATTALLCMPVAPGLACGYEDPQSIAIGALNLAFPDSLHLRTAIWQAQVDGVLPKDPPSPAASTSVAMTPAFATPIAPDVSTNNRAPNHAQTIALMDALRVIEQVRLRLATSADLSRKPPFSMVYSDKMLWTRFVPNAQGVATQNHAAGPESNDVVLITEAVVMNALVVGSLSPEVALRRNLVRVYGDDSSSAAVRDWLLTLAPTAAILFTKE